MRQRYFRWNWYFPFHATDAADRLAVLGDGPHDCVIEQAALLSDHQANGPVDCLHRLQACLNPGDCVVIDRIDHRKHPRAGRNRIAAAW